MIAEGDWVAEFEEPALIKGDGNDIRWVNPLPKQMVAKQIEQQNGLSAASDSCYHLNVAIPHTSFKLLDV